MSIDFGFCVCIYPIYKHAFLGSTILSLSIRLLPIDLVASDYDAWTMTTTTKSEYNSFPPSSHFEIHTHKDQHTENILTTQFF